MVSRLRMVDTGPMAGILRFPMDARCFSGLREQVPQKQELSSNRRVQMTHRWLITAAALAATFAPVSPALAPVAAQATKAATFAPPRAPWGDPDLQGTYDFQNIIPMQRPAELAGKKTLTEAEWIEYAKKHGPNQDRSEERRGG